MIQLPDVPGRIFLDTCIVNFILDYGEYIFDVCSLPENCSERDKEDLIALYNVFLCGRRAC